jgi:hypothetical protein
MDSTSPRKPNDVLLLEARLQQQKSQTHPELSDDEYFLINSVDTVLRARGLSHQEIEDGIVEGPNDGGIDAVYLFQDGNLLEDDSAVSGAERPQLELEVIQVKNEQGFRELALQRLLDHLPLLLQLDPPENLSSEFNERVLERFHLFRTVFLRLSSRFPVLTIRVRYVTKAVEPPNSKVALKSQRLKAKIQDFFREASISVDLIGAADLNDRARERQSSVLEMRVSEGPISAEKGGLVCLVSLMEYMNFITDHEGRLRDEIFEENVRGYEGATLINRGIGDSLREGDDSIADFWWLNNGVSILGRRVQATGKKLVIDDPQIVNGLQTSRNIFQYFADRAFYAKKPKAETRHEGSIRQLLVRVIEAEDEALAAQIIKATNSQNRISIASLRATEPFQRSIEEYFLRRGLYYERKRNQYKGQGKPRKDIVEVLELAQAVGAIIICQPHTARGKPSALVRDPLYKRVFNHKTPLAAYWNCIQVMRRVDAFLEGRPETPNRQERSKVRFHLARAACAFALSSSRPRAQAIANLNVDSFVEAKLEPVLQWVLEARQATEKSTGVTDLEVLSKGPEWSAELDRRLSRYTAKMRWPKGLTAGW